jgi:hypothetical protein
MGATTYPQNVAFGAALIGGGLISIPNFQGNVFYVDPTNGNDGNFGTTPGIGTGAGNGALRTINAALALCTSGAGDTIFVLGSSAGSNENVVVSKDFVSLIGCQIGGYSRPDVVPTTGVPLIVTGQGFVAKHMRFAGTAADACVQRGNGFEYADCVFDGDLTATKAGIRLIPSDTVTSRTASEGKIHDNYFRSNAIGIVFDTALPAVGVGSSDNNIYNNVFSRNTLDLATADTGGGLYSVQFTNIGPGNQFVDKLKATYIDLTTTNGGAAGDQSGSINGNYFGIDAGVATVPTTTQIKMVGTAFTFTGNYGTIGVLNGAGLD